VELGGCATLGCPEAGRRVRAAAQVEREGEGEGEGGDPLAEVGRVALDLAREHAEATRGAVAEGCAVCDGPLLNALTRRMCACGARVHQPCLDEHAAACRRAPATAAITCDVCRAAVRSRERGWCRCGADLHQACAARHRCGEPDRLGGAGKLVVGAALVLSLVGVFVLPLWASVALIFGLDALALTDLARRVRRVRSPGRRVWGGLLLLAITALTGLSVWGFLSPEHVPLRALCYLALWGYPLFFLDWEHLRALERKTW